MNKVGTQQFNESTPLAGTYSFLPAYVPGTAEQVTNANGLPHRVDVLQAINDDTVAHVLHIKLFNGSLTLGDWFVSVPAGAGLPPIAFFDVLAAALPSSQQGIVCPAGYAIYALLDSAPGAGTYVEVVAQGGTL